MKVANYGFLWLGPLHLIVAVSIALGGCVSPHAVLVNKKGDEVVCQAKGFGIISGTMANNRYEQCVSEAQMRGFKVKSANQ